MKHFVSSEQLAKQISVNSQVLNGDKEPKINFD